MRKIKQGTWQRDTMDISDIGKEAVIHWNGPPIAKADSIGEAAINRIFKGGRFFGNSNFSLLFIIYSIGGTL